MEISAEEFSKFGLGLYDPELDPVGASSCIAEVRVLQEKHRKKVVTVVVASSSLSADGCSSKYSE